MREVILPTSPCLSSQDIAAIFCSPDFKENKKDKINTSKSDRNIILNTDGKTKKKC
jgi:hypothetical protein